MTMLVSDDSIYIGSSTQSASSIVQIDSTTQGAIFCRMTEAERDAIASPPEGLKIYNLDTHDYNFYDGSNWRSVGYGESTFADESITPDDLLIQSAGYAFEARMSFTADIGGQTDNSSSSDTIYIVPYSGTIVSLFDGTAYKPYSIGATGVSLDVNQVMNGDITNGSAVITNISSTATLAIGMGLTGTSIQSGSRIVSIDSSTQITISIVTTATATRSLTFQLPLGGNEMTDVYLYLNAGTPKIALDAWTNGTSRSAGQIDFLTHGIPICAAHPEWRYVGTVSPFSGFSDLYNYPEMRRCWNYYNQVRLSLRTIMTDNSVAYSTSAWATYLSMGFSGGLCRIPMVTGMPGTFMSIQFDAITGGNVNSTGISFSGSAPDADCIGMYNSSTAIMHIKSLLNKPLPNTGLNTAQPMGYGIASAVFYGDNNTPTIMQSGLSGWMMG